MINILQRGDYLGGPQESRQMLSNMDIIYVQGKPTTGLNLLKLNPWPDGTVMSCIRTSGGFEVWTYKKDGKVIGQMLSTPHHDEDLLRGCDCDK